MTILGQVGNGRVGLGATPAPDNRIGWTSQGNNAQRRTGDDADRRTRCTAAVIRCPALSTLLLIGEDGDSVNQPSMPMAVASDSPAHAAVWETAQHCYRDFGCIPDRESFAAIAQTIIADTEVYAECNGQVSELIGEVFSPRFDDMNVDAARSLVIDLMEELLVLQPQARALGEWLESHGAVPREVGRRTTDIQAELDAHRSGHRQRLQGYSVAELRREARPPSWHVQGILVQGETTFLSGPAKSLKSGLSVDLGVSLAIPRGSDRDPLFLNRFSAEPANHVLLFSAESGMWVVLNRLDQIFNSRPRNVAMGNRRLLERHEHPADALNLTCYFNPPRLSLKEDQRIVRQEIRDRGATIAIFDPFYLTAISGTNTEASNVYQMGEAIRRIEEVCKEEGATPFFVHHFRKDIKPGVTPTLAHMTFAGAGEAAAQWILVNHRKEFDVENGYARLVMIFGGRAGHAGAWAVDVREGRLNLDFSGREWRVEVLSLEEARERDEQAIGVEQQQRTQGTIVQRADRIAEHLATLPAGEGICLTPLAQQMGLNNRNCRDALERLINQGRVEQCQVRVSNGEHRGFRLIADATEANNNTTEGEDDNG